VYIHQISQDADLAYVRSVMSWDIPQVAAAGIFPSVEQIEVFSQHLQKAAEASAAENDSAATLTEDEMDLEDDGKEQEQKNKQSHGAETTPVSVSNTAVQESKLINPSSAAKSPVKNAADNMRLSSLFERFVELSRLDGRYVLCEHEDMVTISNWLHSIPLTLAER
jgi:hypothetical protein